MKAKVAIALLSLLVLPAINAHGGVISFSDTEFLNANWIGVEVQDTTPNDSFTFSSTQLGTGGNPGAYRQVINQLNTPTASNIASGHLFQGGSFDPGQDGTFISLDMSLDGIGIGGPAGAMGYGVLLEQDSNYFSVGLGQVLNSTGWMTFSGTGLVESDFIALGAGALDLSNAGTPVSIGFFVSNGTFGQPSTNEGGGDNWSLTIQTAQTAIPEPSTFVLFGVGVLGMLGYGWRCRKRTASFHSVA